MRNEIVKAADEAVDMFREFAQTWDCYHDVPSEDKNPERCAILHYEKIVERDRKRYESLFELQKKGREARELEFIHNELLESKAILTELKSRL